MHNINSIYRATEGEGIFIGTPQVFVRYQGCAVGCINCDSMQTWEFSEKFLSLDEVMYQVHSESESHIKPIRRVSITGGDPLHPKNTPSAIELSKRLKSEGFFVNIEAAGTRCIPELFDLVDWISFDYKTPSTGVKFNPRVFKSFLDHYSHKSQIKAVIENEHDFFSYLELYGQYGDKGQWVITPCYNMQEEFPLERFHEVIELNERNGGVFRVIGQQHKWLHGPDKEHI